MPEANAAAGLLLTEAVLQLSVTEMPLMKCWYLPQKRWMHWGLS